MVSSVAEKLRLTPQFDTAKQALRWLEETAREEGMDRPTLSRIQAIGSCESQIEQRILELCRYLEIPRMQVVFPG